MALRGRLAPFVASTLVTASTTGRGVAVRLAIRIRFVRRWLGKLSCKRIELCCQRLELQLHGRCVDAFGAGHEHAPLQQVELVLQLRVRLPEAFMCGLQRGQLRVTFRKHRIAFGEHRA